MLKHKFNGEIKKGTLYFDDDRDIQMHLARLDGKRVVVTVDEFKPEKTINQLGYFHGVIIKCFGEYMGHSPPIAKEILKAHFLSQRVTTTKGVDVEYVKSLETLNIAEMSVFVQGCLDLAVDLGIIIPPPRKVIF